MKRLGRWTLNALTVLSLLLCAVALTLYVDHRVRTRPDTAIRPGMELEWKLTELFAPPKRVTVDALGRVDLPLIGKLDANGLTCAELERKIEDALILAGSTRRLEVEVRILGFQPPGALALSLLLTIPALRVFHNRWRSWRKGRRLRAGLCPSCSYDLAGNVSGVCPECGTAIANGPTNA